MINTAQSAGRLRGDGTREAATVMIVDDDPDIRNVLHFTLTKAGYRVVEASDGEAAIARMKSSDQAEDIATIFCNLQMPHMNGGAVSAHLRTHYPPIPCVILTADPNFLLNEVLAKQGACDYLIKPMAK